MAKKASTKTTTSPGAPNPGMANGQQKPPADGPDKDESQTQANPAAGSGDGSEKPSDGDQSPPTEGGSAGDAKVAPAAEHDTVRLRSRHRQYRVKNVRFDNYVATVTSITAHELSRLAEFGPGKQFWIDEVETSSNTAA